MDSLTELLAPRFLRYVRICTASSREIDETPSCKGQWELAKLLAEELYSLGVLNVEITDHCYVLALLPASAGMENAPAIGLLAHLDTSDDVPANDVKPVVETNDAGETIIRSDGTTLLGADDKAGIAVIMGAAEYLLSNPEIKHGKILIIFTPDEETGKGLPSFPMDILKQHSLVACYTLDGGPMGELETECFNAIEAKVHFRGNVTHLGKARGVPAVHSPASSGLANASLMAAAFAVMLPRSESPEATDGYYGYYCPVDICGNLESAELTVFIRDFDLGRANERARALEVFARAVEAQFPGGSVDLRCKNQYFNMKEKIDRHPEVIRKLENAARLVGVDYVFKPIRGGTDGSRLTELGIPTPNIFTGGRNFHSVNEWVSVPEMETSCRLTIELVRSWAEHYN